MCARVQAGCDDARDPKPERAKGHCQSFPRKPSNLPEQVRCPSATVSVSTLSGIFAGCWIGWPITARCPGCRAAPEPPDAFALHKLLRFPTSDGVGAAQDSPLRVIIRGGVYTSIPLTIPDNTHLTVWLPPYVLDAISSGRR